jgi:hypothetical protein
MIARLFFRAALGVGLFAAALIATHSTALALSEFCPATVDALHRVGGTDVAPVHSYTISAVGPRSVAGKVIVKTTTGWYAFDFPKSALVKREIHAQFTTLHFTRIVYRSDPMYVTVPSPETVEGGYVANAWTSGDTFFGWDAQGNVQCSPPGGFAAKPAASQPVESLASADEAPMLAPPPSGATILNAVSTQAPGSVDCAKPFDFVTVTKAMPPDAPSNYQVNVALEPDINTLVNVLVDADGSVTDAWVYAHSGDGDFDRDVLNAARRSSYAPGVAFCKPVPGAYIFRAGYRP